MCPYELICRVYQRTDLNFAVAGADSQVASLFGPGQWADVVLLALHLHEKSDVSLRGIPQVNTVVKRYSENVSTAPVKEIQICGEKGGPNKCLLGLHMVYTGFLKLKLIPLKPFKRPFPYILKPHCHFEF